MQGRMMPGRRLPAAGACTHASRIGGAGNMISAQPRFTLEEPNTAPLHDAQEISN